MDKPTSLITTLPRLIVGLWLAVVTSGSCLGQSGQVIADGAFVPEVPATYSGSGSFFNRQLGTAFRFGYHTEGYGTQEGVVTLGSMKVIAREGSTLFFDGQATLSDEFGGGFNAGFGYRTLANFGWGYDSRRINGINFWTDGQSTGADNFFTQLGVGLESLGDSVDLRIQGYFPLERTKDGAPVTVPGSTPMFEGDALLGALQQFTRDTALTVVDFEGAKRIANLEAWAFLGGYQLSGGPYDATGYRAGVRGYAVPDLAVSLQVTDDDIYHTNVMFGITWFVGRTHRLNAPCGTLLDRFREPVLRNDFIATTQQIIDDPIEPLTDAVSGDQFVFVHVDSSAPAGGDGTFENPYQTLAEAEAGSSENTIVFVHSGSALAPAATYTAKDGQRILGEGLDPNGMFIDHVVNSAEQGLVSLPETSPGSQMVAAPTIAGTGTVFEMADDNELNNFTINGGVTAVNANGVDSPQLANLDINAPTSDAIVFTDVTGSSLIENTVTIDDAGGRGVYVNGGSGLLGANAAITDSVGYLIEIEGRSGGSVTVGELSQTAGGLGIFVHDNTGGNITFSSPAVVTTTGAANSAVELLDNGGTTILFQQLNATSDDADTFVVTGGGAIVVSDPNDSGLIRNTGTGSALVVTGADGAGTGNPTVTILPDVTNEGGEYAVDIQQMTGGLVTVTGDVTDNDTTGRGILIAQNTAGTYSIGGLTDLNTGTNRAVELNDNTGATITFSDLQATSAATTETFRIEGGGIVDVNDPNGTGFINNTATGSALVVRGDGLVGTGNPTVAIDPNTNNTGGGYAVDIQDMTGGGVTINGDVTDTDGSGSGILVEGNSAGTYSFAGDTTLDTGANSAVTLRDNSGATINFTNLNATAAGGDTFVVEGGGTISVTDPNDTGFINNTGAGSALVVKGDGFAGTGNPTVTIDPDINNSGGGMAVDIQDMTGGGVTINGDVTDTASEGILLQMNSSGTYEFLGDTTITSMGTDNAVFLEENDGATITFSHLMASAVDGDTFTVRGGGIVNVNDPNSTITNSGNGTAVLVRGDTSFDGDPTVSIAADVTNTVGGMSVDIQEMTDGGVTFSGLVDDTDGHVVIRDNSAGSFIFADTLMVDTGADDAVRLLNNTGAILSFNGLDITATGAGAKGFTATGGGTLTVTNANPTTITSAVNTALELDGMTIGAGSVTFDTVSQTAGAVGATGVILKDLDGTGSVTVGADPNMTGTITSSGGGVQIDGGANNITVNTDITTDNGESLEVINRTGGIVTYNGTITDTGDGMNIANNTGGSVNVTGDHTFDTDAGSEAITITNNNGATVNFTGDNIDLMTTADTGIHLSGTNTGVNFDPNVSGGTGTMVEVEGTATATFGGSLTNTAGSSVHVHDLAGGTVTFNGDINDTGTGVVVEDNTGGTVDFAGDLTLNTNTDDAFTVQNNTGGTTNVASADIDTTSGDGVNLVNNTGATVTLQDVEIDTTTGNGFTATGGGTLAVTGTNTVTTTTGTGLNLNGMTISGSGAAFNSVSVNGATNGITLTNLSGGQTRVGAATATGIAGDGGTLQNTNQAIVVNGVTNAVFNDIEVTSTSADAVVVTHTTAAAASIVFDDLSLTTTNVAADGVVVTDNGTGELDFTLRNSMVDVSAADTVGFMFTSGANTGEVDVRLQDSTLLAGDNEAMLVNLTNGTGDVQFLITDNTVQNDSATDDAAAFTNSANRTLNATIGDQDSDAPFDSNTFVNANAGGTALTLETSSAASSINLDLRGNTLSGGASDADLTNTMGFFGVVEESDTVDSPSMTNNGDVTSSGTINNLVPPIKQVD